jgi:hypothetical protein
MALRWLTAHCEQAEHNIRLFNHLHPQSGNTQWNDWKITILFYAALHLAHAQVVIGLTPHIYETRLMQKDKYLTQHHFFNDFINPQSKQKVKHKDVINLNVNFQSVELDPLPYIAYKNLYTASRKTRYLNGMNQFQPNDIFNGILITSFDLQQAYQNLNTIINFFATHQENRVRSIVSRLLPLNLL